MITEGHDGWWKWWLMGMMVNNNYDSEADDRQTDDIWYCRVALITENWSLRIELYQCQTIIPDMHHASWNIGHRTMNYDFWPDLVDFKSLNVQNRKIFSHILLSTVSKRYMGISVYSIYLIQRYPYVFFSRKMIGNFLNSRSSH